MNQSNKKLLTSQTRLYNLEVPLIGLTGGIATGKSKVLQELKNRYGVSYICADQLVHDIYQHKDVKKEISKIAPDCIDLHGNIQFKRLREVFFSNREVKTKIESLIYKRLPLFFQSSWQKIKKQNNNDINFLIYDIPLLFEKSRPELFDHVVLVYCSEDLQKQRLITRDKISPELANTILKAQLNIESKKQLADSIIDNSGPWQQTQANIKKFMEILINEIL